MDEFYCHTVRRFLFRRLLSDEDVKTESYKRWQSDLELSDDFVFCINAKNGRTTYVDAIFI